MLVSCPGTLMTVQNQDGSFSAVCSVAWTSQTSFLPDLSVNDAVTLGSSIALLFVAAFIWRHIRNSL